MFPDTVLGIKVELYYDQRWNRIPANDVRGLGAEDGEIKIGMRGQPDESSGLQVAQATLSINNANGKYSPRNTASVLYGKIGHNTPIRIGADVSSVDDVTDTFDTDGVDGWPVSDSGHTYTVVGTAAEYFVSAGVATMRHAATDTEHRAELQSLMNTDFDVTVDGVTLEAAPTGGNVEVTIRARISGSDWVQGRLVFTSGGSVQCGVEDSTVASSLSTVSGAATTDPMSIRFQTIGRTIRVRAWETSGTEPSTWDVTAETEILSPGYLALTSNLDSTVSNALPFDITFADLSAGLGVIVYSGEIPEWPKRWDSTGRDVWTPIVASGLTRRLVQVNRAERSPLNRTLRQLGLVGYWSFEGLIGDGATHDVLLSDLEGGNFLSRRDWDYNASVVKWGDNKDLVGSGGLPTVSQATDAFGNLSYDEALLPVDSTHNQWSVCYWVRAEIPSGSTAVEADARMTIEAVNGDVQFWELGVTAAESLGSTTLQWSTFGDSGVINNNGTITFDPDWHFYRATVDSSGGAMRLRNYIDEVLVATDTYAVPDIGQPLRVSRIQMNTDDQSVNISSGHFAIASGTGTDAIAANAATIYAAGYEGNAGETATARMTRLCAEEGITFELTTATGETGTLMGPQPVASIVALLEDCAETDGGILYELRSEFGYGYRSRESLYAPATRLALDYTNSDLSEVPEVTDDDQGIVNRFTAKRAAGQGNGYTISKTTGPLSTGDPFNVDPGVGLYEDDASVNVYSDDQLADYAGWRVHMGTWDESRWPGISVALERSQFSGDLGKLAAAAFLDVGEVLSIANTPVWLGGTGSVLLQMRSVAVFLSNFNWGIEWNALPAGPWLSVGVLENTTYGRLDTEGAELVSAVDTDDTELVVYSAQTDDRFESPLWTEDMGELSFGGASGIDFRLNPSTRAGGLGGEQVRAAATASRSDTFTRSGDLIGSASDTGQVWVDTAGTATAPTTDGTKAVFVHPSANSSRFVTLSGPGVNVCATVDVAFSVASAGGADLLAMMAVRVTDASNYYSARLTLTGGGSAVANLSVVETVAGTDTTLSSSNVAYTVTNTANTLIRVKVMILRRGIFAKAWLPSADEPDWMIVLPDAATDLLSGSDIGLRTLRSTGNTDANATFHFDNLSVITPKIRPYASDLFARTVANGFGSADEGGAWTTLSEGGVAASSDFNVANGAATTTHTSTETVRGGYLDDVDLTDVCVSLVFSGPLPTGATLDLARVALRGTSSTAYLSASVNVATTGAMSIGFYDDGVLIGSQTLPYFTYVADAQYRLKAAIDGSDFRAKVWPVSGNEPENWYSTTVDYAVSGWVGFVTRRYLGNTNVNAQMSIRDFRVENPQRMTVQRGVNGAEKSWPAGNDIRLWTPAILGR